MKSKRELQFLTYLDALEEGDAEGISAFLALAEVDAELEKMMMDYHNEDKPAEAANVIPPIKRKRNDVNQWGRRLGTGLVAVFVMALVGAVGVFVGSQDFLYQTISTQSPHYVNDCRAELTSDNNTVTLIKSGDIDRAMTVGVNNPFIVVLEAGGNMGSYEALFEGLNVIIPSSSIEITGDCSTVRNITVFPQDIPDRTCFMEIERLNFPVPLYSADMWNLGYSAYTEPLVLLDAPVDGAYPIMDDLFEARIPAEHVQITGDCTTFPLLYVQPIEKTLPTRPDLLMSPILELASLSVSEQRFERGTMFYLEAMQEIWIACDAGDKSWLSWLVVPEQQMNLDVYLDDSETPSDGLFEPEGIFISAWQFIELQGATTSCDLGWATGTITSYEAAYRFENDAHHLSSSTGDFYSFHANRELGEYIWQIEN